MSANQSASDLIPKLPARYTELRVLAAGGQGGVLRAKLHGRRVVLKAIDDDGSLDATAVFALLQGIASPHLPDAIELVSDAAQRRWLVTAYLEGAPLRVEAVPLESVLDEAIGVGHALCTLHQAGTHHGDVSANNVLRTSTGGIVLTDLGCLGARGVGTPGYLAPESLAGQGGPASDRFALGSLICARLFGALPWRRPERLAALKPAGVAPRLRALRDEAGVELGRLEGALFEVLESLLDPRPGARPDDPVALVRSLEKLRTLARADDATGEGDWGLTRWRVPRRWPFFGPLRDAVEQAAAALRSDEPPRLVLVSGPDASGRGRVVRELAAHLQRAGLDAPALDAVAFDDGEAGTWLERWLDSRDASEAGVPRLCTQVPRWPARFEGEGEDAEALRFAVLRAGAGLARSSVVLVVSPAMATAFAELPEAERRGVLRLELTPLALAEAERVIGSAIEGPRRDRWVELAHALSEGWPAALVRCLRAAQSADLQQPDAARWREALANLDPGLPPEVARRALMSAWGVQAPDLPTRYTHEGRVLAWVVAAARRQLGERATALASACAEALGERGEPLPLALALQVGRVDAIVEAAPARLDARRDAELLAWIERSPSAVPPDLALRAAELHLRRGDPGRAQEALARVAGGERAASPDASWEARARLLRARSALRSGQARRCLELLEDIEGELAGEASSASRMHARGIRIRALVDAGETETALVQGRALWSSLSEDTSPREGVEALAEAGACAWAAYAAMSAGLEASDASCPARALLARALELCAQPSGGESSEAAAAAVVARAQQLLGNLEGLQGHGREARAAYARAARAFRQAHEPGAATWLEGNLAATALEAGELVHAQSIARRVLRNLLARGEMQALGAAVWNVSEILVSSGAAEEARQSCAWVARVIEAGQASALDRARVDGAAALAGAPTSELERAREALVAAGATREAAALALVAAGRARVAGHEGRAREALATARVHGGEGEGGLALDLELEALEQARAFEDLQALRRAADELASRPEPSAAVASGRRLVAWRIDRSLYRAVLRLHGPAHAATAALKKRALEHLEWMMKQSPTHERKTTRDALLDDHGDRGPLDDLLREVGAQVAAGESTLRASSPRASESAPERGVEANRLLRMYRRLAREDDLERLLEQVCDAMMELTDAERGVVVVRAGDTRLELAREFAEHDQRGPNFSRSIIEKVLDTGLPLLSVDASEDERFGESKSISHLNLRSVVAVPLRFRGDLLGAAYVDHRLRRGAFAESDLALMEDFAELAGLAVAQAHALREARLRAETLAKEQSELSSLLDMRDAEVQGLRETIRAQRDDRSAYRGMVGASPAMQKLYRLVDRLADSVVPVVIYGESGTGKELVARALHDAGPRAEAPFVAENCGAIPETLLESVFFGHAKGAFTGANAARAGLFEAADGGTIFLDEIGEMSMAMQTKLLRVLQEGEVRRVGETKTRKVDVRVVAASNRDLQALVEAGGFRRDLFYRINVVRLELPPLRDRREDVLALVDHFLARYGADGLELSASARRQLLRYAWPGNVRELENEVQRWVALVEDKVRPDDLASSIRDADGVVDDPDDLRIKPRVEAMERALIARALERSSGNQTHAAELLGLSRYGLQKKLKRFEEEAST